MYVRACVCVKLQLKCLKILQTCNWGQALMPVLMKDKNIQSIIVGWPKFIWENPSEVSINSESANK